MVISATGSTFSTEIDHNHAITMNDTSIIQADEPIQSPNEDQLSVGPFVDILSKYIRTTSLQSTVVFAINAPWGSGKSSILNLLEKKLSAPSHHDANNPTVESNPTPIILRFNPWHYANVEQLIRMFFDELSSGIGKKKYGKTAKRIGKGISELGKIVGAIPRDFVPIAGLTHYIVSSVISSASKIGGEQLSFSPHTISDCPTG